MAEFINNRGPVNEYGVEASFNSVGVSEEEFKLHYEMIKPRLFLGHYVSISLQYHYLIITNLILILDDQKCRASC